MLGAGLVVRPCVDYLTRRGCAVSLASGVEDEASQLCSSLPSEQQALVSPQFLQVDLSDAEGGSELATLIASSDAVISLLPAPRAYCQYVKQASIEWF